MWQQGELATDKLHSECSHMEHIHTYKTICFVLIQNLDFQALEESTEYDGGYNKDSRIIKYVDA